MGTYSVTARMSISGGDSNWYNVNFGALNIPSSEEFVSFVITKADTLSGRNISRSSSPWTQLSWNTTYTDRALINCASSWSAPQIRLQNGTSFQMTVDITITVTTRTRYTAVTSGNKILATDRSQTGTATSAGSVISDSHFSSGTKITASDFNRVILGL